MKYIVKTGNTLWSIARKFCVMAEDIMEANSNILCFKPGDKLGLLLNNFYS